MKYKDYLNTTDWKNKRKAKRKKKNRCGICGSQDLIDTHHLNYKNLFDVELSDLRLMCRRCHFLAHDLHRAGKIIFKSTNHHSRWVIIKGQVKKELGCSGVNLFNSQRPPEGQAVRIP